MHHLLRFSLRKLSPPSLSFLSPRASLTIVRFMSLTTLSRFWIGLKLSLSCPRFMPLKRAAPVIRFSPCFEVYCWECGIGCRLFNCCNAFIVTCCFVSFAILNWGVMSLKHQHWDGFAINWLNTICGNAFWERSTTSLKPRASF